MNQRSSRPPTPGEALIADRILALAGPDGKDGPTVDFRQTVDGIDCSHGHFNDTAAHLCQACGTPLAQRNTKPREGIRPSLGTLVLDNGSAYQLDADYVIGRDPRRLTGTARALKITHAVGGVSRLHLRVSLRDWAVVVTDLGSVNGTRLSMPRTGKIVRLEPHRPVGISPGTHILFAGRWIRYETRERP